MSRFKAWMREHILLACSFSQVGQAILRMLLVSVLCSGCDASSQDSRNIPAFGDPDFLAKINEMRSDKGMKLICVGFWNGWTAIFIDPNGALTIDNPPRDAPPKPSEDLKQRLVYHAVIRGYIWDHHNLRESTDSPLVRPEAIQSLHNLVPVDGLLDNVRLDYRDAYERAKSWRLHQIMFIYTPLSLPLLTGIAHDGKFRPIWVLPYAYWLAEGIVGVFADDGTVIHGISATDNGITE